MESHMRMFCRKENCFMTDHELWTRCLHCLYFLFNTFFVHTNGQVRHSNRLSRGGVLDSIWFNRVQSLTDGFISCENTGGIRRRSVPPLVNPSVRLYVPLVPPYFCPDFSLYKDVKSAYLAHFWNTYYDWPKRKYNTRFWHLFSLAEDKNMITKRKSFQNRLYMLKI